MFLKFKVNILGVPAKAVGLSAVHGTAANP